MLNNLHNGSANAGAASFKMLLLKPSGPVALFVFRFFNILQTTGGSIILLLILCLAAGGSPSGSVEVSSTGDWLIK